MAFILRLPDSVDKRLAYAASHLSVSKTEFVEMAVGVAIAADEELSKMVQFSERRHVEREPVPA